MLTWFNKCKDKCKKTEVEYMATQAESADGTRCESKQRVVSMQDSPVSDVDSELFEELVMMPIHPEIEQQVIDIAPVPDINSPRKAF